MKKKILSLLTTLVMVVGLVVVMPIIGVSAETSGDYEYKILDDGTVEITGYNGSAKSLNIPNTLGGKKVTSIGDSAFGGCENLISIIIPNNIVSIGESAFEYCTSLTSIMIPDSVTSIGDYAFHGCTSLTSITVDENNQYYSSQYSVLFNKDKTELIYYPEGKTDNSYNIPNSVTSIGYYAFFGCTSLTSITIPNSVEEIGRNALGYIYDYETGDYLKKENFKIYCYKGTAGEQYAIDNGFDYELIDDENLVTLEEIDINADGKISTADVGLINAHAKGTRLLSDDALAKADVNKDGKVSTADVGLINAYAKGTKKYA